MPSVFGVRLANGNKSKEMFVSLMFLFGNKRLLAEALKSKLKRFQLALYFYFVSLFVLCFVRCSKHGKWNRTSFSFPKEIVNRLIEGSKWKSFVFFSYHEYFWDFCIRKKGSAFYFTYLNVWNIVVDMCLTLCEFVTKENCLDNEKSRS